MPHIIVKLVAGRAELQKRRLAEAVTHAVISALHCDAEAVSVALEEVWLEDWAETVYRPEILGNMESLYKKPGYNPL